MNAANIIAFLNGSLSAKELQKKIEPEVTAWANRLSERGRSAPIVLTNMQGHVDVTPQHADKLLSSLMTDDISSASFAYILDALLLEERFRWTSITARDAMEYVLGHEYPEKFDKRRLWRVKSELAALVSRHR
jgi:hypothetical protein